LELIAMSLIRSQSAATRTQLIDAVMEGYVTWREECAAVAVTYQAWTRSSEEERAKAYDSYVAALEHEEHAAARYQRLIERAAA
jgi:hypothetical protein